MKFETFSEDNSPKKLRCELHAEVVNMSWCPGVTCLFWIRTLDTSALAKSLGLASKGKPTGGTPAFGHKTHGNGSEVCVNACF